MNIEDMTKEALNNKIDNAILFGKLGDGHNTYPINYDDPLIRAGVGIVNNFFSRITTLFIDLHGQGLYRLHYSKKYQVYWYYIKQNVIKRANKRTQDKNGE